MLKLGKATRLVAALARYSTGAGRAPPKRLPWATIGVVSVLGGALGYFYGRHQVLQHLPSDKFPNESTTKLNSISAPKYCTREDMEIAIKKLGDIIGKDKITNSNIELDHHSDNGFTSHPPQPLDRPAYIIYPESTADVVEIMKLMNKYRVPVVPYAGGTSLEGHFFSTRQGIVVDTSKMNKIVAIHQNDLDAVVQPGVNWQRLNEVLAPDSLMIGSDCGHNGMMGGMINTNASGVNASKYGAMILNVVSVTVVLADGTVVKTKQRPRKSSAGYNLTGLFIGSEGTLGIVTEATIKLHVKPPYETVAVGQFATILDATNAVAQIFRQGIQPNAIELLDKDMMHCINYCGYFTREWLEVPTIFFKVGGLNKKVADEYVKEIKRISEVNNCQSFLFAKNDQEKEELFDARKNALYAILDYGKNEISPDVKLWITDIAVPLSRLSTYVSKITEIADKSGLQRVLLGHVGDSNIHFDIFYTSETEEQCKKVVDEMMIIGLQSEGTSSGEHGIGTSKRRYLEMELGTEAVDMMRRLKFALDPNRILNPDKVFKIDPTDNREY